MDDRLFCEVREDAFLVLSRNGMGRKAEDELGYRWLITLSWWWRNKGGQMAAKLERWRRCFDKTDEYRGGT